MDRPTSTGGLFPALSRHKQARIPRGLSQIHASFTKAQQRRAAAASILMPRAIPAAAISCIWLWVLPGGGQRRSWLPRIPRGRGQRSFTAGGPLPTIAVAFFPSYHSPTAPVCFDLFVFCRDYFLAQDLSPEFLLPANRSLWW